MSVFYTGAGIFLSKIHPQTKVSEDPSDMAEFLSKEPLAFSPREYNEIISTIVY